MKAFPRQNTGISTINCPFLHKKTLKTKDFANIHDISPILQPGIGAEEEHRLICNFTRSINHYMKKLAAELGIKSNLTTYVARHSYATILKHMGTSIEEISESLGHCNITTTRNYLASFPKRHKIETSNRLTSLF